MHSVKVIDKVIKSPNQKLVMEQIQTMLTHFETYNFLTKQDKNTFQFDFNSYHLKESVKNEWCLTNSVHSDHPTFSFNSLKDQKNFKKAFEKVRNLISLPPFSLIEMSKADSKTKSHSSNIAEMMRNQFKFGDVTMMINHMICMPQSATEIFYRQQRERKIWWRKFAALPSRFHTTEICTDEKNKCQYVEIRAEFPWGVETVEVIKYFPEYLNYDSIFFEIKSARKRCLPQVVTCETTLEKAAFTYLCDSYEKFNEDTGGEMLRFSKKLAPYKVAFAVQKNTPGIAQNLKDLATLLAKKIRKCGITVFMLPDFYTASAESQIVRNDALGIPYTILLNEQTLKDGILSIRNRDTTLKEQSHVSLIVAYIEKMIRNS